MFKGKQRSGTWGVLVLALWALVLAVATLANLLLLSAVVRVASGNGPSQAQIWITFIVSAIFGLGFVFSAYGLWKRHNWGRVLFLWTVAVWFSINLIALFSPIPIFSSQQSYTVSSLILNSLRYVIGLLLPLWYLNLHQVKILFVADEEEMAG